MASKRAKPGLRPRGNSWVVRYRRDGKAHWKSYRTKEEAERALAQARLRKALRQPEPQLGRKRFDAFAQEWLQFMRGHVSAKSWEGYEGILRVHLAPELGRRLLTEITRRELDGSGRLGRGWPALPGTSTAGARGGGAPGGRGAA